MNEESKVTLYNVATFDQTVLMQKKENSISPIL